MDTLTSLAAISVSSQQLVNLASAFLGGSIILVISTTHVSPTTFPARLIYLALIPCWASLAGSILAGDAVLRKYLAAMLAKSPEKIIQIFEAANSKYGLQLNCLRLAILFFGIWLLAYIVWWVFFRTTDSGAIEK